MHKFNKKFTISNKKILDFCKNLSDLLISLVIFHSKKIYPKNSTIPLPQFLRLLCNFIFILYFVYFNVSKM